MSDNSIHKDALNFLGLKSEGKGVHVYKSACLYDNDGKWYHQFKVHISNLLNNRDKKVIGAFVVYEGEKRLIHYSQNGYVDIDNNSEFLKYMAEAMRIGRMPLVTSDSRYEKQRDTLNQKLANALSQASYGNYPSSKQYIEEAEKYYKSIISEHIRKHNNIIGGIYCGIALIALLILFIFHSYECGIKLNESTEVWSVGIIASIIGAFVSICHESKVRIIKDKENATWSDFIMEVTIRILFGIILAIILIAAVKVGLILHSLSEKNDIKVYLLIGFFAGFMEAKTTSLATKLSKLIGVFDSDDVSLSKKNNVKIKNAKDYSTQE